MYKFDPEDAKRFSREQSIQTKIRGDELVFAECPYCRAKDKGTFAINLKSGQFKCMRASCGAHGNMLTLHADFGFDLGSDYAEYEKPRYAWRTFKHPQEGFHSSVAALKYLHGIRNIDEDIVRKYEVTTHKDDPNRLVFPFVDEDGNVAFVKYRAINFDKSKGGSKEWCERDMRAILFGMNHCTESDPLVITEGQIDSLSVASCGIPNAVSVPTGKNGMTWIPHCWNWLKRFKTIIVFGDFEHGKMTLLDDIKSRLDYNVTIKAIVPGAYKGCKDANELLMKHGKIAIVNAIKTAEPIMMDQVMRLSDVAYEDGTNDERLPTGIQSLDKVLQGGLAFGYLDILTGKRGEGKSTFGSMLIKSALEEGRSVFIYSGEMKKGDTRKWLDLQIAGTERIESYITEHGYTKYELSKPISTQIGNWYRDRAYIYDSTSLTESTTDLLTIVETSIKRFGCEFVLIDNLMTAIDICGSEIQQKFERQEAVCKHLARLAQKYNVLILLIAHKKKQDKYSTDENDDVLGSSEITNLAGAVMSYERNSKIGDDERLIKLTKNRLTGRLSNGIKVAYDPVSKRIFENAASQHKTSKAFLTESTNQIPNGYEVVDDENLPF